jgi:hypothetical protein
MAEQMGLYRAGQGVTSRDAAKDIAADSHTLRQMVLAWLVKAGDEGATDIEMQHGLEMDPSTQRPRRVELVRAGLVEDSGKKRINPRSGKRCVVWRATTPQPKGGK